MSVNNIKEQKNVDEQNFDYLMAESNFKIESVFRQRNKIEKEAQPTILGDLKSITSTPTMTEMKNFATPDSNNTKTGGTFDYLIPANAYGIVDLRDGEFDIQAQYAYYDEAPVLADGTYKLWGAINKPTFGNQCLLSLFSQIQLFIDDKEVQCIKNPGLTANAEFALRYPHCKTLELNYEVNGFQPTDASKYEIDSDYASADSTGADAKQAEVNKDYSNQTITLKVFRTNPVASATAPTPEAYLYTGFITQRIKLGDIFSCVETLPPLYNHSILIRFNRSPNNDIICNTFTFSNARCQLLDFRKFKYVQDSYITTDQVIQYAKKYYSRPIETIFTQEKTILQAIPTTPTGSSLIEVPINVDAAYKNKLLTIAIPRTNNFSWQPNSNKNFYSIPTSYSSADAFCAKKSVNNLTVNQHYDILKAPGNSYTYGGVRSLVVRCVGSGTELYRFTPEADGVIKVPTHVLNRYGPSTQNNFATSDFQIANYQNVYREYQKARLHFQQSEEEALDFETFMKEYCIYCVDLSPFDITAGEMIKITIETSSWEGNYNPFYAYNDTASGREASKSMLCCLFCDKVLRLLPDARCEICDMISANSVEVENANMSV